MKHGIYNPRKENLVQTIKIAVENQRSSREGKEKVTSNGLSNSSCNLVTFVAETKQFKIYIKKIKSVGLNPKGGN